MKSLVLLIFALPLLAMEPPSSPEIKIEAWVNGELKLLTRAEVKSWLAETEPVKETSIERNPWPTFELIEGKLPGLYLKSRSVTYLPEKRQILALPYKKKYNLTIDLDGQKTTRKAVDYSGYIGSAKVGGFSYHFPAWAKNIAVTNLKTGEVSLIKPMRWSPQLRCGALAGNGKIYMGAMNKSGSLRSYDPAADKLENVKYHPDRNYNQGRFAAASDGDGNAIFAPWYGDKIDVVRSDGTIEELPGSAESFHVDPGAVRHSGGCYDPESNRVVFFPRRSNGILIVEGGAKSHSSHKLPDDFLAKYGDQSKYFDCFVGPDGLVYGVPWSVPALARINPETFEIEWREYPGMAVPEGYSKGNGQYTRAIVIGTEAYLIPGGNPQAAKLKFNSK